MINGVDPSSFRINSVESPFKRFMRRLSIVVGIVFLAPLCLIFIGVIGLIVSGGDANTNPTAATTEQVAPPAKEVSAPAEEARKSQPSPEAQPAQQPVEQAPAPVSDPVPAAPANPAPPVQQAPAPVVVAPDTSVTYAKCDDVRAAGKAPIHRGDPGYSGNLDRDGDGIGCED